MRKLLMGALAVSATLADRRRRRRVAQAADPDEADAELDVTAKPTNAGTKKKPKNMKLDFKLAVSTSRARRRVDRPRAAEGLKFSGKGFKKCNVDDLLAEGITRLPVRLEGRPEGHRHRRSSALAGPERRSTSTSTPFVEDTNTFAVLPVAAAAAPSRPSSHGEITNRAAS